MNCLTREAINKNLNQGVNFKLGLIRALKDHEQLVTTEQLMAFVGQFCEKIAEIVYKQPNGEEIYTEISASIDHIGF